MLLFSTNNNIDMIRCATVATNLRQQKGLKMLLILLAILGFFQCKSSAVRFEPEELAEIDVTHDYPHKEFYLQDIAKVEYISFETNDNVLMGRSIKIFFVSDDYIIAANTAEGDIFVYTGSDKWKYSFNHKGQWLGEYIYRTIVMSTMICRLSYISFFASRRDVSSVQVLKKRIILSSVII
jgi:hypothetical protein